MAASTNPDVGVGIDVDVDVDVGSDFDVGAAAGARPCLSVDCKALVSKGSKRFWQRPPKKTTTPTSTARKMTVNPIRQGF